MSTPEPKTTGHKRPVRRSERRSVRLEGYVVRASGISHVIELVDLNYGGCGITISTELHPGELLTLSVLGRGSIPAQVRWCSDGRAGLDFTGTINAGRKQVARRAFRIAISADVGLRGRGRNSYRVRAIDLSTDGCSVELVERPSVGDRMSVRFDGLEVLEADVCWVEGHRAGLMFQNRVHPAVLDLLLKRIGATE